MLSKAQKGGYAVGAFNVENMEMVKAVIAAAEELKAPVMLQTTPSTDVYKRQAVTVAVYAKSPGIKYPNEPERKYNYGTESCCNHHNGKW